MSSPPAVRRALLSVFDKTGLVEFARVLATEFGVELISTGGTARALRDAGLSVTLVEQVTGFPELMDGRVKTLHPRIHAALLADRENADHVRQLAEQDIAPIDMVVVNLYPFEETIAQPDCTFAQAIEMIDIGGPCLLRAAAKNHRHVWVVAHAAAYGQVLEALRGPADQQADTRTTLAREAFAATCAYDARVSDWLGSHLPADTSRQARHLHLLRRRGLRYGENPHQSAELLRWQPPRGGLDLTTAEVAADSAATPMSFNNYVDAEAALTLCAELARNATTHLWYRLPAGTPPPASSRRTSDQPRGIGPELLTRRYLPHIQTIGRTYFITFRTRDVVLSEAARDAVLSACRHWHGQRMNLHIAVVMPDHVHLLLTPYLLDDGSAVSLEQLMHSIKSFSSKQVNRLMHRTGPVWMQERFDRIMRNHQEFRETWEYTEANPQRAGLGADYRWVWKSDTEFEEAGVVESGQGLEAPDRDAYRLEADTTTEAHPAAACFIKHTNACGAAVDPDPLEAYRRAYLGDPNAAMGGILAVNFPVTADFAAAVLETYARFGKPLKDAGASHAPGGFFVEVWIAPAFDDKAIAIIRGQVDDRPQKPWGQRVRLLAVGDLTATADADAVDLKPVAGGLLLQSTDTLGLNEEQWQVVTERQPTEDELRDLRLAWLVCKHTKSNAITICRDGTLLGSGAGQMSRVMSCRVATWLARENGHDPAGAVAASDAFFPFRDGPDILIDAGVTAIIQPGGSKRDEDVIAACNERGVAMICTGTRHFRH